MTVPLRVRWPVLRSSGFGAVAVVVLAAVVGFLLVGRVEGDTTAADPLAAETEGDLARILAGLNAEADALQAELAELRVQLNELRRTSQNDTAAARALADQLRSLQVLAGTVAVQGPGVDVVLRDPRGAVTYDTMIDIVQELRDAGAEAIAINDHRVGATSAFGEAAGRVTLDGVRLEAPYRIVAIGHPATLEGGLKIPGGAVDTATALPGVEIQVQRAARVEAPALARPPTFDAARPVGSSE